MTLNSKVNLGLFATLLAFIFYLSTLPPLH